MSHMLQAIERARRPLALTGAGISAPSGLPTFDTTWRGQPIRAFLGRRYFKQHPVDFFELYCELEKWCDAAPNAAHRALAARQIPVVTQNVDGLHQKAGSERVIELHGNLRNLICPKCGRVYSAHAVCETIRPLYAAKDIEAVRRNLKCACGGWLDVDVVLYEDAVRGFEQAVDWLMESDLLLVIGTSLGTYPAASLPEIARKRRVLVMVEDQDCIAALTT